jgi:hypothetical protein
MVTLQQRTGTLIEKTDLLIAAISQSSNPHIAIISNCCHEILPIDFSPLRTLHFRQCLLIG